MTHCRVYVAHHDSRSKQTAEFVREQVFRGASLVSCEEGSVYFENSALLKLMMGQRRHEWGTCDYVGMVPYSIVHKTLPCVLEQAHRAASASSHDVIAFLTHPVPMLRHATLSHGPWFLAAWVRLLQHCMQIPLETVLDDGLIGFYCNAWLARPALFAEYGAFLQACIHHMETDAELKHLLCAHSPTYSSKVRADDGATPLQYTMHPFVLERLPPLFFKMRAATVYMPQLQA